MKRALAELRTLLLHPPTPTTFVYIIHKCTGIICLFIISLLNFTFRSRVFWFPAQNELRSHILKSVHVNDPYTLATNVKYYFEWISWVRMLLYFSVWYYCLWIEILVFVSKHLDMLCYAKMHWFSSLTCSLVCSDTLKYVLKII